MKGREEELDARLLLQAQNLQGKRKILETLKQYITKQQNVNEMLLVNQV